MKFKVGDRVRISARACSRGAGNTGKLSSFDGKCWRIDDKYCCYENELEAVMRTIDDLREGDVVVSSMGTERDVLGVCGRAIFVTSSAGKDRGEDIIWTKEDFKRRGYTLVQPKPDQVTITVDGKETVISRESAISLKLIKED